MKRYMILILALVLALTMLCAGCGGNDAPETPEAEATELPTVTKKPTDDQAVSNIVGADDNAAPMQRADGDALAAMGEQQRYVEENLAGEEVQALYDYLGQPISTEYTTSCVTADGLDGLLYYDGFYVSTTRFASGEEIIWGTGN